MADAIHSTTQVKNTHRHHSIISSSNLGRHCGYVKAFMEDKGFGFFAVRGYPDIFFRIDDMHAVGINSVEKGDKFNFDVFRRLDKDSKVTYRAKKMEFVVGHRHNIENTGAIVTIPNPIHRSSLQVTGHNGEIVVKNLNKEKPGIRHSKPLNMSASMIRVGPSCVVPMPRNGSIVVSATGPNSAELAPQPKKYENPEVLKLKEIIGKKKSLFKGLKLEKLPDGGRRLKDEIIAMEIELQKLSFKKKTNEETHRFPKQNTDKENKLPVPKPDVKPKQSVQPWLLEGYAPNVKDTKVTSAFNMHSQKKLMQTKLTFPKHEPIGSKVSAFDVESYDMGPMQFNNDGPLYGGRMTSTRLTEVRKVTKAAIEELHKSLETRPEPDGELDDPLGVKVPLMLHQKQALAWLVWRESQSMSGGILADDMGLGKTLTMISLILIQREIAKLNGDSAVKEEDDIKDFDSSSDSRDSDVILINDDKSGIMKDCKESSKQEKSELVETESTLIVAPASLLFHWEKEIRNRCNKGLLSIHLFHGTSREKDPTRLAEFDVVITTYDIVRRCASSKENDNKQESTLMHIEWRRIILDEAHQIKNFKSASSEAACKLEAKTRWAMSGTPVQNNLTDMYAMLKFLHCRPFDEYKVWKHQVDNKTTNGKERLKTLVSCIVLRREKSQNGTNGKPLVNLPKRTFVTHKLKLNSVEREVYDKLQSESQDAFRKMQDKKKETADRNLANKSSHFSGPGNLNTAVKEKSDSSLTATTLLVMLLRLRQCCGHLSLLKKSFDPELLSNEKKEMALEDMFQTMDINKTPVKIADINVASYVEKNKANYFEMSSVSGKVEFVLDELNKLRFEKPDDKCVIVSQWTSMLEVVAYHLEKSEISYVIIKGSVPAKKRMDMVDDFNRNPTWPMVILLSLQAGGVGLNLVGGNHLYLLDMHWNPALECQAFDRIYRVGQIKPVFVHKFVVEDTVEERILKLQEYKLSIAKAVMQGAGLEDRKKLSLQDMKLLFGI